MTLHEFWQCPTCKNRFWTLSPRPKLLCPGCLTRAVPISFKTYVQPDSKKSLATAFVSIDTPE